MTILEFLTIKDGIPPGANPFGGILFMLDHFLFVAVTLRYRHSAWLSAGIWLVVSAVTLAILLMPTPGFFQMQLLQLPVLIGGVAMSRDRFRTTAYICFERQNISFITHTLSAYLTSLLGYAGMIPALAISFLIAWRYWKNREKNDLFFSWLNKSKIPFFIFPLYVIVVTRILLAFALDGAHPWAYGSALSIIVMMLMVSATVNFAVTQGVKAKDAERHAAELRTVKRQMMLHAAQIDRYAETQGNIARLHHDMRHHYRAIAGFLAQGDTESALRHIDGVERELDLNQITVYCENYTVNVLLLIYKERAKAEGVRFDIAASLPVHLLIDSLEIVSLFSNALENALEAASHVPDEANRSMSLFCDYQDGTLKLRVENTISAPVIWGDGELPVSTKDGGGIGTKSIAHVAEKYGGILEFSSNENIFTMRAMLFDV